MLYVSSFFKCVFFCAVLCLLRDLQLSSPIQIAVLYTYVYLYVGGGAPRQSRKAISIKQFRCSRLVVFPPVTRRLTRRTVFRIKSIWRCVYRRDGINVRADKSIAEIQSGLWRGNSIRRFMCNIVKSHTCACLSFE